ncbi:unnamed protein product [Amaranthus hypochondriacus]
MEAISWLVILAAILFLTYHILYNRKLNLPPGPKPWPIIGNFNLIGPLPHLSIHNLSKKYGPLMMIHLGSVPVLIGSSVEMAELFLKTHDLAFAGRPKNAAGKYTTHDYSNITWSQYGPYLRQARKLCMTELFNTKRLDSFEYIRIEELNLMLKGIYEVKGKSILVKDYLSNYSLNVISRMVLGNKYVDDKEGNSIIKSKEFKGMIDELFLLNGVFNLGDWIPFLKYVDVQGYVKRMKILGRKLDGFMEHVLDEHNDRKNKEKGNWVAKDMVDLLLQLGGHPTIQIDLNRKRIKGFIQDLITGGTESSAITVEWAMTELLRNPDIMDKAVEELDRVIGKEKWVQEEDLKNLPYICAIIKETLRLHPPGPFLVPHMSREHVNINGYDIPKDTLIFVNTYTIQRDAKVYDRPEEFQPDRFIGKNIDIKGSHFELLPFGSGRRMCPGYNLGIKVICSSLANLLQGYTWKLPKDMKPEDLDMEEKFGISIPKKSPLIACAEPRHPHHLYNV